MRGACPASRPRTGNSRLGEPAAHHRNLVAIRIAHIGGVEIRVVLRAQARRTFTHATIRERGRMERVYFGPGSRGECSHCAIARARGLAIEWLAHPERVLPAPVFLVGAPAGPA